MYRSLFQPTLLLAATLAGLCLVADVQGASYPFTHADIDNLANQATPGASGNRTLLYGQTDPSFLNSTGYVKTYMEFFNGTDRYTAPKAIGVEFQLNVTDPTLLPTPTEIFNITGQHCAVYGTLGESACAPPGLDTWLTFPGADVGFSPFRALDFWWESEGHEPMGVYTLPHFDIHFHFHDQEYITTNVLPGPCSAGTVAPQTWSIGNEPFNQGCFAGPTWANLGLMIPFMGNHLINLAAPEFAFLSAGGPPSGFNNTFILGTYNSSVIFYEVMTTGKYFNDFSTPGRRCQNLVGTPPQYPTSGFRPSAYCHERTPDVFRTEFTNFTWYEAAPACQPGNRTAGFAPASFVNLSMSNVTLLPVCVAPNNLTATA